MTRVSRTCRRRLIGRGRRPLIVAGAPAGALALVAVVIGQSRVRRQANQIAPSTAASAMSRPKRAPRPSGSPAGL